MSLSLSLSLPRSASLILLCCVCTCVRFGAHFGRLSRLLINEFSNNFQQPAQEGGRAGGGLQAAAPTG